MLEEIKDAVLKGDREGVVRFVNSALGEGVEIRKILDEGLIAGMEIVGARFKNNEIYIPEVLISAKAMQTGMALLEPHFVKCGIRPIGRVIIGTVKGDLHDIGKNIVSMMLKSACFEVDDLGIDVPSERFVSGARRSETQIIAMSSLLTTSMSWMRDVIICLKDAGLRDRVRVMVGGAPVTQNFADSIGADGYAKDAASAVDLAKELLRKRTVLRG